VIGTVIKEQYKIIELMGEGGMGSVYRACDLELGRQVALKFLRADLAENNILLQRFRDELRTLAGFNHPNITTLFTSVTWQDHPVMVMELVEGETLQAMVNRRGPIPASVCVPLIQQALAGVGSAHRKKIIHRDLKPANLMLNLDGVVKVMDFGIAKMQDGGSPALTRTNAPIGTSLYMAPEQILGQTADPRSDIYAMGVTLYELLAGRVPFLGDSQYAIAHAHMQRIPEPPTAHYPHIPENVVAAVMKSLAKDPALRFQSAEEFVAALGDPRVAGGGDSFRATPPPATPPPPVWSVTPPPVAPPPSQEHARPEPIFVPPPPLPVQTQEQGLPKALLAIAAGLVLAAVGGIWMHSSSVKPAIKRYELTAYSGSGGGNSGPSESEAKSKPATAPGTSGRDTEPFIIAPLKPPASTATPAKRDAESRISPPPRGNSPVNETLTPHDGLPGQWAGSYERCEDGRSTRVTLKLNESRPGFVSGNLRFTAPDGTTGRCSMDGVVLSQGKKVSLKASVCSGATPAYFATGHQSLLSYSGMELTGSVDPETPCMIVTLRKSEQ
jgi:serine/threonine protein kinase